MASQCTFLYLLENPPPLPLRLPQMGPLGGFRGFPADPIEVTTPRLRLTAVAGAQLPSPTGGPFRLRIAPEGYPSGGTGLPILGLRFSGPAWRVLHPEEEIPPPRPVPAQFQQQPSGDGNLGIELELRPCDYEELYYNGVVNLDLEPGCTQALANLYYYGIGATEMPAVFDDNYPALEFEGYLSEEVGG